MEEKNKLTKRESQSIKYPAAKAFANYKVYPKVSF
jgi:hypothetical protein